jgi:RNA polymerase sigma-70 factor (ECF subfamily)
MRASEEADEERRLVERHRYGDPSAFEHVYERFSGMVYNLALRLSGSPDRAQDLTQEVFLRIYRHLARFRGRSSLKTWVYRICLNHCRSRLGRRRLRLESLGDSEDGRSVVEPVDPARGPEDLALADETGRRIASALSRVPGTFREALVLRDLEGLSYREIASVLGVRIGTVRSRIARGRDQLRKVLEEADHE